MRADINSGFEDVLSAVDEIASAVRGITSAAPQTQHSRATRREARASKITTDPYRRPPPHNQRAVRTICATDCDYADIEI